MMSDGADEEVFVVCDTAWELSATFLDDEQKQVGNSEVFFCWLMIVQCG